MVGARRGAAAGAAGVAVAWALEVVLTALEGGGRLPGAAVIALGTLGMATGGLVGAVAGAWLGWCARVEAAGPPRRARIVRILGPALLVSLPLSATWLAFLDTRWTSFSGLVRGLLVVGLLGFQGLVIALVKRWRERPPAQAAWLLAGATVWLVWADRALFVGTYRLFHAALALAAVGCAAGLAARRPGRLERFAHPLVLLALVVAGGVGATTFPSTPETSRHFAMQKMPLARKLVRAWRGVADRDRDGYAAILAGGDCDDADPAVHPGALDLPGNGRDEDCSGADAAIQALRATGGASTVAARDDLNVVLITIDTVRADRLSVYGHTRGTSPALERFAAKATLFERAYSPSNDTGTSIPALLTGRYASNSPWSFSHRCRRAWEPNRVVWPNLVDADNVTLAEMLAAKGYRTSMVSAIRNLVGGGIDQGFEKNHAEQLYGRGVRALDRIYPLADDFLRAHRDERFFLWIHDYLPHHPYEKHPGFDFGDTPVDRYDSELAASDARVGAFLDRLDALGLSDRTMVIVTADHGEEFGDHGGKGHTTTLHEEQIRVPLIVHVPGVAATRVARPVQLVDVVPTVLARLGMPAPPFLDGHDLFGGQGPAYAYSERMHCGTLQLRALMGARHKLIVDAGDGTRALYDLHRDPRETRNLADADPSRLAELEGALAGFVAQKELRLIALAAKRAPGAALQLARNLPHDVRPATVAVGLDTLRAAAPDAEAAAAIAPHVGRLLARDGLERDLVDKAVATLASLRGPAGLRELLRHADGPHAKAVAVVLRARDAALGPLREARRLAGSAAALAPAARPARLRQALALDPTDPQLKRQLADALAITETRVKLTPEVPPTVAAGSTLRVRVMVGNEGKVPVGGGWIGTHPSDLRVMVAWKKGRETVGPVTDLALHRFRPRTARAVIVRPVAPEVPGDYTLRLSIAHDGRPVLPADGANETLTPVVVE